ncbi:MAG: DMT family transporter [Acidimicrobiales bacterium]|nr:DMT family transporter [Acidimicrobiales bacterium]
MTVVDGATAPVAKIVTVMVLWAACFPLITVGIDRAPHITFAALRALLAGTALVGTAAVSGRLRPIGGHHWRLLTVAGLGATTLGFLGMFHAAEFISPGLATVIANTQPLLAAALAYTILGERIGRLGVTGLAIGFAGIAVIAAPGLTDAGGEDYILGVAYVLLAALGITVSNVAFKRLAGEVDALIAAGAQLLIGAVPLTALALLTEDSSAVEWSPAFAASLIGLALPGTALAYGLWVSVLESTTLNRANAFSFLVPIFGLAIGISFYGELLTPLIATGAAIALGGIALVHHAEATTRNGESAHRPAALADRLPSPSNTAEDP